MVSTRGFDYRGHHLVCPQGKILNRGRFHNRDGIYQYVARQKDCQACPVKADCLPPGQKRLYIGLTMYHPLHLRARERNRTAAYRREQKGRHIVSEVHIRYKQTEPFSSTWSRYHTPRRR